jgi:hypothetical protein
MITRPQRPARGRDSTPPTVEIVVLVDETGAALVDETGAAFLG